MHFTKSNVYLEIPIYRMVLSPADIIIVKTAWGINTENNYIVTQRGMGCLHLQPPIPFPNENFSPFAFICISCKVELSFYGVEFEEC